MFLDYFFGAQAMKNNILRAKNGERQYDIQNGTKLRTGIRHNSIYTSMERF
jgi:hypothetical protein